MSRSSWSGMVSFGLVQFPVRLYGSVQDRTVRFHTVHRECGSRTNAPTVCRTCDREVTDKAELVKGYAVSKEQLVLLDDGDFENLPLVSTKTVEITECVFPELVPLEMQEKVYYVGPDERQRVGHKAFVLFRDALAKTGKVAIGRIALRTGRENLCAIRPHGDALALQVLHWGDELAGSTDVEASVQQVQVAPEEAKLAEQLIGSLVKDGDSQLFEYRDAYREALELMIDDKLAGKEPTRMPEQPKQESADLLAALQASLKKAA